MSTLLPRSILWCWRRLLRVPWTARRSNQSILKEISREHSLEGLMLKLKLQYFGHPMQRNDSWRRPWCWERLKAGGEGDHRGWDGWMASPTRWTWVWASSRSWWWTGRPGVLRFMGLKELDTTERLNWTGSVFLCLPCPLLHLWHCYWEQKLWGETELVLGSEHFHVLTVWYCKEPSMVLKKWLSYLSFKIQFRGNRPCASYLAIPFSPKLTLLYWLCDAGPGFCLACGHPLQDWKKNKGLPFSWVRPSGCLLLGTSNTCSPSCGFLEFFLSYFNHRTVNLQCCLISALQQNDSVICIYWHIFSIVVYYRILKSVPCGIQ